MKIEFTPVGVSFEDTAPNITYLSVGSEVSFEHRPGFYGTGERRKEYPNAVVILFNGMKVGSLAESALPESPQQQILKMLLRGDNPVGNVIELMEPGPNDKFKKTYKLSVVVPETKPEPKKATEKKQSFNEEGVEIEYNPVDHSGTYQGKKLISATTYVKRFYKEFDTENVAKACANSWGVDAADITRLWKSQGDVSAAFGNAVHLALEHYSKFRELGQKISLARAMVESYADFKHPWLKEIIDGFIRIDEAQGDVFSEAFLTNVDKGILGTTDRITVIDKENKICDVDDYKVNVNCEEIEKGLKPLAPYDKLPANKLTKYQIQLSIYANLLQASGWTVRKLNVYVLEEGWKHYELPVLQVI